MSDMKRIRAPFDEATARSLRAGDRVLITGTIIAARDAAHKRLVETLARGEELPVDLDGAVIYYVGPSPAKPGRAIGAAGPTTAGRMDAYTPTLLAQGLRGMIGKGYRKPEVVEAMKRHGVPYLAAVGGAGALISQRIKKYTVLAYPDWALRPWPRWKWKTSRPSWSSTVPATTITRPARPRTGSCSEQIMRGKETPLADAQRGPLPPRPHPSPNAFHSGGWRPSLHTGLPMPAGPPATVSIDSIKKRRTGIFPSAAFVCCFAVPPGCGQPARSCTYRKG